MREKGGVEQSDATQSKVRGADLAARPSQYG